MTNPTTTSTAGQRWMAQAACSCFFCSGVSSPLSRAPAGSGVSEVSEIGGSPRPNARRFHMSPHHEVPLTLEAADVIRFPDGNGGTVLEVSPSFITAGLLQAWREREARVILTHAATHDIELTVAEARELAEALSGLVRQAADAAGGAS